MVLDAMSAKAGSVFERDDTLLQLPHLAVLTHIVDLRTQIVNNFKIIVHFLLQFELHVPTIPYFKELEETRIAIELIMTCTCMPGSGSTGVQEIFSRLNRDRGIVVAGVRLDPETKVPKKTLKKEVNAPGLQSGVL